MKVNKFNRFTKPTEYGLLEPLRYLVLRRIKNPVFLLDRVAMFRSLTGGLNPIEGHGVMYKQVIETREGKKVLIINYSVVLPVTPSKHKVSIPTLRGNRKHLEYFCRGCPPSLGYFPLHPEGVSKPAGTILSSKLLRFGGSKQVIDLRINRHGMFLAWEVRGVHIIG